MEINSGQQVFTEKLLCARRLAGGERLRELCIEFLLVSGFLCRGRSNTLSAKSWVAVDMVLPTTEL